MRKYLKGYVKTESGSGKFSVIASTSSIDRQGESIDQAGWDFANYRKNPVMLWAHNYSELPVGKADAIEVKDGQLVVDGTFASKEANPFADQVRQLYEQGILNAVSVGFIPMERQGHIITQSELLEISFVPVPANPEALALVRTMKGFEEVADWLAKGMENEDAAIAPEEKAAVPPHDTPMMDKGTTWDGVAARKELAVWASSDGSGDKEKMDWSKYAKGFAWYDSENPEEFGSYKLPHHIVVDGELKVVWRGVAAAMSALMGGRGGVDATDMQGIHEHLSEHYKQFDETPPDMKTADEIESTVVGIEEKSGRVISSANREKITNAISALEAAKTVLGDMLSMSEPQKDGKAAGETRSNLVVIERGTLEALRDWVRHSDKANEHALSAIKDTLK